MYVCSICMCIDGMYMYTCTRKKTQFTQPWVATDTDTGTGTIDMTCTL